MRSERKRRKRKRMKKKASFGETRKRLFFRLQFELLLTLTVDLPLGLAPEATHNFSTQAAQACDELCAVINVKSHFFSHRLNPQNSKTEEKEKFACGIPPSTAFKVDLMAMARNQCLNKFSQCFLAVSSSREFF